jgi:carbon monoxide dehydrogenase subunit G
MKRSGAYRIGASADAVWLALNDPEVLSQCIEGCQSVTRTADDAFAATVKAKIGPLNTVFTADIRLADLDPPAAYTLEASVKGGAAGGFAKGSARVSLTEDGRQTLLRYDADGSVGGKLAEVGQRLIDADVRRIADDFFSRFSEVVTHAGSATERAVAPRRSLLAPILIAVAAIAGLFALLRWRRPAASRPMAKTA